MARRRPIRPAKAGVGAGTGQRAGVGGDLAARIAWAYLAAVVAAAGTGFLLVLGAAIFPAVCSGRPDPGECSLGWTLATGFFGFALLMLPVCWLGDLDWYLYPAFLGGFAALVVVGPFEHWWWWALLFLLPAAAAAASAAYREPRPLWQRASLILVGVAGATGLGWWLYAG